LAAKYGKTPGQVILNWHIKGRGHLIIPKTTKVERLTENHQVYDFALTDQEYASISSLDLNARAFNPKHISGFNFNNLPYFD
jgi:2,5-diketo-D-gluconate reductase A